MKPFIPLLLIALSVCVPAIDAASISRKTLVVAEPLGFLTKFILNKRAKAVNAERNDDVQTLGATKRESVILETPIVAAASIQIEVKAEPKGTKNQIQSASEKQAIVSTSPRSTTTTDASTWSWYELNNPKKTMKTNTRDVIKLSFRGNANTARSVTETAAVEAAPVEVVETPADVTPVEEVPVKVVDTIAQDTVVASAGASASSTDGSPVSMSATPQAVEKKGTIHIVASPKHRILYEDNTPEYHVTLQVIKVELDPAYILPIPDTMAVDAKPAEITSGVDASAASSAAGTGEASAVGTQTVATETLDSSVDGGIPIGGVTSGNVQVNLDSGSYVPQSGLAGTGVTGVTGATGATGVTAVTGGAGGAGGAGIAGGAEIAGGTGIAGGAGIVGGAEIAGGTGITGGTGIAGGAGIAGIAGVTGVTGTTGLAGATGTTGGTAKKEKSGGTGAESDSSEEDE